VKRLSRRQFLQAAAALGGGIFVADAVLEARGLSVTRADLASPLVPAGLDGMTIAHLSDLHLPCAAAERAAALLAREPVDVIAITGDTISHKTELGLITSFMQRLTPRLGTFVTRGNNDRWARVPLSTIKQHFAGGGATLLENSHAAVERGGARLQLIGLDDPSSGHPDVRVAWRGADPALPTVWLMHAPGFIDTLHPAALKLPRALLVLAGHTHGGQIRGPGCTPVVPRGCGRFRQGFYDADLGRVYVSRGIGTSVLPMRFLCPPEVAIFTLRHTT
jgi:predicted MPP superfamily phosphohydrolase